MKNFHFGEIAYIIVFVIAIIFRFVIPEKKKLIVAFIFFIISALSLYILFYFDINISRGFKFAVIISNAVLTYNYFEAEIKNNQH